MIKVINKRIEELKNELNNMIENGTDYSKLQKTSEQLDECIIELLKGYEVVNK